MRPALPDAAGDGSAQLPAQVVCSLFESLSFEELLEDAGVAAALEAALVQLAPSHELQLAQGGRYPGLYRLLAHPNSAIRSIVGAHAAFVSDCVHFFVCSRESIIDELRVILACLVPPGRDQQ